MVPTLTKHSQSEGTDTGKPALKVQAEWGSAGSWGPGKHKSLKILTTEVIFFFFTEWKLSSLLHQRSQLLVPQNNPTTKREEETV